MLMYNTNDDTLLTRAQLAAVPTPNGQGRFHQPVGFGEYVDYVERSLGAHGMQVAEQEYCVTKDHNAFFGLLEVTPLEGGAELIRARDWRLLVGLRGSHDQRMPRGLVLGSSVIVCSNLCFSGNIADFRTKQTTHIWSRLPRLIDQAVGQIPQLAVEQERKFEAYRNFEMKPRWGDAALVEVHRRGGLTAAQLGRAVAEWDHPSYDAHAEQGFTAWRLMNAVTEAHKPTGERFNPNLVADRTVIASRFIDEVVGF